MYVFLDDSSNRRVVLYKYILKKNTVTYFCISNASFLFKILVASIKFDTKYYAMLSINYYILGYFYGGPGYTQ